MERKNPSLKDLAQAAGVSTATASVVINNKVGSKVRVGKETQERIWAVAKKIGYVGNPAARKLAGGRNNIVGIFSYESIFPTEQYSFYHSILLGIEQEAEAKELDLLLVTYRGQQKDQRHQRIHRLRLADGAILLGLEQDENEVVELVHSGYKLVVIGRRDFPGINVSYVVPDYADATKRIAERVYSLGHRRVAYLQWNEVRTPSLDREIGFRTALSLYPDLHGSIYKTPEREIEPDYVEGLLSQGVTAFVVERYLTAEILIKKLSTLGLKVPHDISVCVLGGPGRDQVSPLDWTTIEVPGYELGKAAIRILLDLLNDPSASPIRQVLECPIHFGATLSTPSKERT